MNLSVDEAIIKDYCLNHELSRPPIKWGKICNIVVGFEIFLITCLTLSRLSVGSFITYFDIAHAAVFLFFGKQILKQLVQIYQHYASERTRRQCQCMPTCSEYALLALDKYWWGKAVWLIIKRVTYTCQKPGYKVDYP